MLRNEFNYGYSDNPYKACDVWITIVTSMECILNSTRGGNIRGENVMLLMAVSNVRRENVIWNFLRRNTHFSSLDVRNAWKRSRNSAMWRSHTSATRVFLFLWKRGNTNLRGFTVNFENRIRPAPRGVREMPNVFYRGFHHGWYFRTWIIS